MLSPPKMLLRHFLNADLLLIVKNRKCIQVHLINSEIKLSLKHFFNDHTAKRPVFKTP